MKALLAHPSVELYGADRMFLETVRALAEGDWGIHVVLPGDGPLALRLRDQSVPVLDVTVPVLRKAMMSPPGAVRYLAQAARALPEMIRVIRRVRPDVVYVSTLTIPVWLLAAAVCRVRLVCHVHEAEETVPRVVRKGLTWPLLLADVVLANSAASRRALLVEAPRLRSRTIVVYNGVRPPAASASPRAVLTGAIQLVLVGRISPRKGTDIAVEALHLLVQRGHDVVLDLVGGSFAGYEWFDHALRQRVAELGLGERVRWRGEQSDPYGLLAQADIALVPSRVEPFGNTAVEAILARRPLVAARTQGLVEIVRPGPTAVLVAPGDPTALARGVADLLDGWSAAVAGTDAEAAEARARYSPARYRRDIVATMKRSTPGRGAGRPGR